MEQEDSVVKELAEIIALKTEDLSLSDKVLEFLDDYDEDKVSLTQENLDILNEYIDSVGGELDDYVYTIIDKAMEKSDPKELLLLADLNGIDLDELTEAMEKTKDAEYIYKLGLLSNDVEKYSGINVTELGMAEIETKNKEYILKFANEVKYADIEPFTKWICSEKNIDVKTLYDFATTIDGVDQKRISQKIAKIGDYEAIMQVIQNFSKYSVKALTEKITKLKNAKQCFDFAAALPSNKVNVALLSSGVVQSEKFASGDVEEFNYVCEFVQTYAPQNLDEYREVLTKLGNEEYSNRFEKICLEIENKQLEGEMSLN